MPRSARLLSLPVLFCLLALPAAPAQQPAAVELVLIENVREFPEATEPGAIRYACAQDRPTIEAFFSQKELPFEPNLVRRYKGRRACHIFYEPTIPGFRPSPDNGAVTALFGSIDPVNFIGRRKSIGDSLDVIKAVLDRAPRPVNLSLGITAEYDAAYWPEALALHFPKTPHGIRLYRSEANKSHPWAQDFLKAGDVNGELRILTPRRIFEGREADGDAFRPLLDALKDDHFSRSKISWEGGDLQFMVDPKDPSKRVLFFGGSARDYWGKHLDMREYAYVLKVEFGASSSVDLSDVGPHADYLVTFLPAARLAIVAQPVRNNLDVAFGAATALADHYKGRAPKEIGRLVAYLANHAPGSELDTAYVKREVAELKRKLPDVPMVMDARLNDRIEAHITQYCPDDPEACFGEGGKQRMLEVDPELFRESVDLAVDIENDSSLTPKLLSLIESQMPDAPETTALHLEDVAQEMQSLGFKVTRFPYLVAPDLFKTWPGISYVNLLVFDKLVFVPEFGLGEAEQALFRLMQRRVPEGYQIVPIYARQGVLMNGGIHCVFGIVRAPLTDPGAAGATR